MHLVGFIIKKFVTMHCHMSIKDGINSKTQMISRHSAADTIWEMPAAVTVFETLVTNSK